MAEENSEYKLFGNRDMDRIGDNSFMVPIFNDVLLKYKFRKVLDYGCGNGIFGIYLKQRTNCNLVGVDGSEYGLRKASELGYDETFRAEDLCTQVLPFGDESFDLVIMKDILEHLLDPLFILKESRRLLATGGLLFLHVPNHFPLGYRIKFLFTNRIDTQNYFPDADDWDYPHIRFFTHRGLMEKLEEHGFQVLENYSHYFTTYSPVIKHIPFSRAFHRYLAKKHPDQFSIGYTYLLKKIP